MPAEPTPAGPSVDVDTTMLRIAADQLDSMFADTAKRLSDTDNAIASAGRGWTENSRSSFDRFTGYVDTRRVSLLTNIAGLSEALLAAAIAYETQDHANATDIATVTGTAHTPGVSA